MFLYKAVIRTEDTCIRPQLLQVSSVLINSCGRIQVSSVLMNSCGRIQVSSVLINSCGRIQVSSVLINSCGRIQVYMYKKKPIKRIKAKTKIIKIKFDVI
jgi:hypothetical protein